MSGRHIGHDGVWLHTMSIMLNARRRCGYCQLAAMTGHRQLGIQQ
ncbi:hypothetical protein D083_3909 [Dickeya solani RNS 08.23.3.1.A]|nr:hypothetical protein D083_3909 [Dickeya solani RNS 08.23.3.1.A]